MRAIGTHATGMRAIRTHATGMRAIRMHATGMRKIRSDDVDNFRGINGTVTPSRKDELRWIPGIV